MTNVTLRIRPGGIGLCVMSLGFALALSLVLTGATDRLAAQEVPGQQRAILPREAEVLTRGPMHEAFATPVVFDPKPGPIVSMPPPELIEEIPPDQKPAGDNVVWISGNWSWEDDRQRYLWVSGIWRVVPPDLEWISGYWAKRDDGHQFVSGFWRPSAVDDINYLPVPPASVESGPVGTPPSADHVWVPGNWVWRDTRYVWRPGYYVGCRHGWIWVPASYVWTPAGCIFVDGYWDYSIRRRGVLFAPIAFAQGYYPPAGFAYGPTVVIDTDICTDHLFVNVYRRQYYFGDYYANNYLTVGIYPWFAFHSSRYGYDPVFAYYGWHNQRYDNDWNDRIRHDYWHRRDNAVARPASTVSLAALADGPTVASAAGSSALLGATLGHFASRKDSAMQFENVGAQRRQEMTAGVKGLRAVRDVRIQAESAAKSPLIADPNQLDGAERGVGKSHAIKLPKSVLSSKSAVVPDAAQAPPAKPQIPNLDLNKKADLPKAQPVSPRIDPREVLPERSRPDKKSRPPELIPDRSRDVPKVIPNVPKSEPRNPKVPKLEPTPVPRAEPRPQPIPRAEPRPEPRPPRAEPRAPRPETREPRGPSKSGGKKDK